MLSNALIKSSNRFLRSRPQICFSTANSFSNEIKSFENLHFVSSVVKDEHVVNATDRWVKEMVIGHKLCPFAYKYKKSIHVANTDSIEDGCRYVLLHIEHLLAADQLDVSTKLIVFPSHSMMDVENFFYLAGHVQHGAIIRNIKKFEIVPFHPLSSKQYGNSTGIPNMKTHPGHFTIRSPYPTIHLFKTKDVDVEVANWEKTHKKVIPLNQAGRKSIADIQMKNELITSKLGYAALDKQMKSFTADAPHFEPERSSDSEQRAKLITAADAIRKFGDAIRVGDKGVMESFVERMNLQKMNDAAEEGRFESLADGLKRIRQQQKLSEQPTPPVPVTHDRRPFVAKKSNKKK